MKYTIDGRFIKKSIVEEFLNPTTPDPIVIAAMQSPPAATPPAATPQSLSVEEARELITEIKFWRDALAKVLEDRSSRGKIYTQFEEEEYLNLSNRFKLISIDLEENLELKVAGNPVPDLPKKIEEYNAVFEEFKIVDKKDQDINGKMQIIYKSYDTNTMSVENLRMRIDEEKKIIDFYREWPGKKHLHEAAEKLITHESKQYRLAGELQDELLIYLNKNLELKEAGNPEIDKPKQKISDMWINRRELHDYVERGIPLPSDEEPSSATPSDVVANYTAAIKGSGLDNTLILLIVLAVFFYKLRK